MLPHEKEGEQRYAYTKQKLIPNPIPTFLLVVCLCKHTFSYKKVSIVPAVSLSNINRHIIRMKQ